VVEPVDRSISAQARDASRLGALRNGLAVLDLFRMDRQALTATEIARELGIHKSTASRIASNLMLSGYLVPATNGHGYRLSGKLARLGAIASADTDLTTASVDHVRALVDDTGETCHVGVLEGHEAVTVVLVDGSFSVRLHSWVGKRSEAYSTAMGKVLLAGLSDPTLDMLFPGRTLEPKTGHTITTVAALKEQLAQVRRHGFALDDEELEPGLRCVAAPIHDHNHQVVAALTIAGASSRLTMARIDEYIAKVMACAARISESLGAEVSDEDAAG
jgi:DNA-binding IclR family transcriptional regulator